MLKDKIEPIFKRYIEQTLQRDEVFHLRNTPEDALEVRNAVEGLELRLSDYTEALVTNDFSAFSDDIAFFIGEHFSTYRLESTDEVYHVLAREYLKATAYCIKISIHRSRGDYFNEPICAWMPDHLASLEEIQTERDSSSIFASSSGRPSRNWDAINDELNKRHQAGELADKSRTSISSELADWYNHNHDTPVKMDTVRKNLQKMFDRLGL